MRKPDQVGAAIGTTATTSLNSKKDVAKIDVFLNHIK